MVEALKKMDKKILIIVGIIILLPILIIVFLAIIQACGNSKITPEKYEERMIVAVQNYFEDTVGLPSKEGETREVELSTLVGREYIKSTGDLIGDNTCLGSVTVRRNGSTVSENKGGYLNYIANLECKDYKTNTLINNLMEDLTTTGSGLYQLNNYYVYKGDEVNNYVKFFDKNYRIMNIDENGIVKLIKAESESLDRYWDNKYNIDVNDIYGKNIYADSAILKYLMDDYNNVKVISNTAKEHIVSKDVCIDSRDLNNGAIGDYSCSTKLENQVISLIDVTDYAKASLDMDCNSIYSKSCRNYNYLKDLNLMSWTLNAVSNNTYQVYYLSNGIIRSQEASKYHNYNLVIYIDGTENIASGDGTFEAPYVIK